MGARYYAAWLGRWTSADPMGIGADGPGLYNYTRGSPVVFTDPGGMETPKGELTPEQKEQVWAAVRQVEAEVAAINLKFASGQAGKGVTGTNASARDIEGAEGVLASGGMFGSLLSSVLPDSAKEAAGGALRKQSERTLAPLALAEMLFVPATNAQEAAEKSDAIIGMAPGILNPGLPIGDSINRNLDAAQNSETVGGTAYGVYGLAMDGADIGSVIFGGGVKAPKGGPKSPGPVSNPKPTGPYRTPGAGGGGGGPTGGGPTGAGPTGGGVPDLLGLLKARLRQQAGFAEEGTPVILDENISKKGMSEALRGRGFNVRDVFEVFGRGGIDDADISNVARAADGRVLTQNSRDFPPDLRIASPAKQGINVDLFEQLMNNNGVKKTR